MIVSTGKEMQLRYGKTEKHHSAAGAVSPAGLRGRLQEIFAGGNGEVLLLNFKLEI